MRFSGCVVKNFSWGKRKRISVCGDISKEEIPSACKALYKGQPMAPKSPFFLRWQRMEERVLTNPKMCFLQTIKEAELNIVVNNFKSL